MAHKTFYVTRTENPVTHTAGAATLNRADQPQLMKVFDTAEDIDPTALSAYEVVGTKESDFEAVSIVDRVAVDNMNPVTSSAVANALEWEEFTPYSTSNNVTNVKMYKRFEGSFVHYLFRADGVGTIAIGQSEQITVQLYQSKPIAIIGRSAIAANNYAGRVSVAEDYSTEDLSISKVNHYIWDAGNSAVNGWKLSFELYTQE